MPSTVDPLLFPEQIYGTTWTTLEREALDAAEAAESTDQRPLP